MRYCQSGVGVGAGQPSETLWFGSQASHLSAVDPRGGHEFQIMLWTEGMVELFPVVRMVFRTFSSKAHRVNFLGKFTSEHTL